MLALISKFIGCGLPAFAFLRNRIQAQRIGIGMASRGEVGVVVAGIGYSAGMIDSYAYAVLMSVIMITTIISPILLRFSYNDQKIKSTL